MCSRLVLEKHLGITTPMFLDGENGGRAWDFASMGDVLPIRSLYQHSW